MHYNFEWDPGKAKQNPEKHKVRFERAAEIFLDPLAVSIYDEDHSTDEDRWVTEKQGAVSYPNNFCLDSHQE